MHLCSMLLQLRGGHDTAGAVLGQPQQRGRLWRQARQAVAGRGRPVRPQQRPCSLPHMLVWVLDEARLALSPCPVCMSFLVLTETLSCSTSPVTSDAVVA